MIYVSCGPSEIFSDRFVNNLTLQLPGFAIFLVQSDDPEIVILTTFFYLSTLVESAIIKTIKVSLCVCITWLNLLICRSVILVIGALELVANTGIERKEELMNNCTY